MATEKLPKSSPLRAKKLPLPSIEVLRELLTYNPDTGELFWRARDAKWYSDKGKIGKWHVDSQGKANRWNALYAGKRAATKRPNSGTGYLTIRILNVRMGAHRAAWAIAYGAWPKDEIDHINHIKTDNRLANLRSVTKLDNCHNVKMTVRNTSGVVGVAWLKTKRKWRASIRVAKITIYLGQFDAFEDAVTARKNAERAYGFHPNHGSNQRPTSPVRSGKIEVVG